jgi:hypothetical protein
MRRHDTGPVPYPLALVITLAVEVAIYLVVLRAARLLPGWRGLLAAVGVNLATHPVLWLILTAHPGWFIPAEACVCLVEAGLLWLLAGRRGAGLLLVTAVAANTASILAGAVLYGLTVQ